MSELLKRLEVKKRYSYSSHTHEVNWDDIVDIVEDYDQLQLNPNQQIVLDWLKSTWTERKNMHWFPFEVINSLYYQFDSVWGNHDFKEVEQIEKAKPHIKAYGELTALEQLPILQAFSQWALEQEAE